MSAAGECRREGEAATTATHILEKPLRVPQPVEEGHCLFSKTCRAPLSSCARVSAVVLDPCPPPQRGGMPASPQNSILHTHAAFITAESPLWPQSWELNGRLDVDMTRLPQCPSLFQAACAFNCHPSPSPLVWVRALALPCHGAFKEGGPITLDCPPCGPA